jgi:cobalt/nickel transport system permease protein
MGGHHAHPTDRPAEARGPLGGLPTELKFATALLLLLALVLMPPARWDGLLVIGTIIAVLLILSRVTFRQLAKRLLLLEPLVLGVAGLTWFEPDGHRIFLLLMFKANLCLLTTFLLAQTTSFSELIALLKRLHAPWLVVIIFTLMHRYLFVLADEAERMQRARASRTFAAGCHRQWLSLSSVIGQLFLRASDRAERIYNAMCARGWK